MKKKILFPATNRVHKARQGLLLEELSKSFEVVVPEYQPFGKDMAEKAEDFTGFFLNEVKKEKPDLLLARGDRFEILPAVMIAAYSNIPTAHIEGGDLSAVIDGKIRHAISQLANYHFPTHQEAHQRLLGMGVPIDRVWNFGSLDTEFALSVKTKTIKRKPYILVAYHPIPGEDPKEVELALKHFNYDIVRIASNSDYGKKYGSEEYSPEEYVSLVRFSACCVGNSSSFFKEASVFGTPVVNVGNRQMGRLRTRNILDVDCEIESIKRGVKYQIECGRKVDTTYYQPDTSKKITKKLEELLA